jgi:hypothetical protein
MGKLYIGSAMSQVKSKNVLIYDVVNLMGHKFMQQYRPYDRVTFMIYP